MNDFWIAVCFAIAGVAIFGAIVGLIKLFDPQPVEAVRPADDEWLADIRDTDTEVFERVADSDPPALEGALVDGVVEVVPLTGPLFDPIDISEDAPAPLFAELRLSLPFTAFTHAVLAGIKAPEEVTA